MAWEADFLTNNWVEHSNLEISGGLVHHVWSDGQGINAVIRHATCDLSTGTDCTHQADWVQQPDVVAAKNAQFPEIVVDGDRRFVIYEYEEGSSFSPEWRVQLATQCAGDTSWNVVPIRETIHMPPGRQSWDQIIAIGKPSIALNREEDIVHVVFAEIKEDYTGQWNLGATDGDLFWYWSEYPPCP